MLLDKEKINQEDIFKVPEGYFENFDNQLKRIIHPEESKKIAIPKFAVLKPWIGLVASFLLIALVYNIVTTKNIDKIDNYAVNFNEIENCWTEEWTGTHEIMDILSEQTINVDDLEMYPDSLFLSGITYDDIIFLSLSDY